MLAGARESRDPYGAALELLGQLGDLRRHGGREHQRPPILRCRAQHELEVLAEAEVEHLICLVQHHRADLAKVERATLDVITKPARRPHDDMRAPLERPTLVAHVHSADARGDACPRLSIQPAELAHHLEGQLARWRNHKSERSTCGAERFRPAEQRRGDRQAEAHGLARPGLRRHEQVGFLKLGIGHGLLNGCQGVESALGERIGESLYHREGNLAGSGGTTHCVCRGEHKREAIACSSSDVHLPPALVAC